MRKITGARAVPAGLWKNRRDEEAGGGRGRAPAERGRMRIVAGVPFGGRGSGWRRLTLNAGRGDAHGEKRCNSARELGAERALGFRCNPSREPASGRKT